MLKCAGFRGSVAGLFAIGCTCIQAQSTGYHLELRQMPSGVRVAFVNDGPRSIDAYEIYRDCGPDDPQWMFRTLYGDYLRFNPAYWAGLSVLPSGDSWVTPLVDRGPTCQPSVKAVIFSDGTAEGDPVSLALIQAARDGYSDEVSFWAERLGLENSVAPRWEELLAEANARQSVAHSMSFRRDLSKQARAYWGGA